MFLTNDPAEYLYRIYFLLLDILTQKTKFHNKSYLSDQEIRASNNKK
jgi:hypothetical protein